MKFINPSIEIWEQDVTNPDTLVEAMWAHIARCVRVCYQVDKPKNNETEEEYVRRVIFRKPEERLANHYSVLEHGALYLKVPTNLDPKRNRCLVGTLWENKYTKRKLVDEGKKSFWYFSTDLRVIIENDILIALAFMVPFNPEHHYRRVTVSFITNIGVTREANRHRADSPSEESTRCCNYSQGRFGNNIAYSVPPELDKGYLEALSQTYAVPVTEPNKCNDAILVFVSALRYSELCYLQLLKLGWSTDQARRVLNLNTKSQLIHTAFIDDWKDFLKLRADAISGSVHPDMLEVAKPLKEEFINRKYI